MYQCSVLLEFFIICYKIGYNEVAEALDMRNGGATWMRSACDSTVSGMARRI